MSTTPSTSEDDQNNLNDRDQLLAECRRLLYQVSRRPNGAKLLLGVKKQLEMFNQYKRNR